MKTFDFTARAALVALMWGGGLGLHAAGDSPAAEAPVESIVAKAPLTVKGEDWQSSADLSKQLAAEIKAQLPDLTEKGVTQFLSNPQNRLRLAQWMWAEAEARSSGIALSKLAEKKRQTDAQEQTVKRLLERCELQGGHLSPRDAHALKQAEVRLSQLKLELEQPVDFAMALKSPEVVAFMDWVGNNPDVMERIAYSGDILFPGKVLNLFYCIYQQHPEVMTDPMVRDIALATALEFAKSDWLHHRAMERADYFIRHWKARDLNVVFDTLPFWERRMVCGCWGDDNFGSLKSLEWALKHVHLPADRYTEDCPHHLYRLHNLYGESIHGNHYEEPYSDIYGTNRVAFVREVGGICGHLSKFCTFSALANGVPALTTGEPGHCSYVVKVGDEWVPGYSLDWRRGLQWLPWHGMTVYSCLHVASELFSVAEEKNTQLSQAWRTLALIYADDEAKALTCWQQSVKSQPLNIYAWREYANFLSLNRKGDAASWTKLNRDVCETLARRYPEVAAALLTQSVYGGLRDSVKTAPELRYAVHEFWKQVDAMGPDRWRIEELLQVQKDMVCAVGGEKELIPMFEDALTLLATNSAYAPVLISWGNEQAEHMKGAEREQLMAAMIKSLGAGSNEMEGREKMLAPLFLAAEKAQDMTTFQSLSKMLPSRRTAVNESFPSHKPFPGLLTSQGGILWGSSTSQWDDPSEHWGVLEPGVGGRIHPDNDNPGWVVVQLTRQTKVSGVVVIEPGLFPNRVAGLRLQVSETGRDDDWHDVCDFKQVGSREHRADTQGANPVAKYVRIFRPGGPLVFSLNGIYVYGQPSA